MGLLYYGLNVCDPLKIHVQILLPNVMVLGGGILGMCLGHKGGVLMNGISVLIKDPTRAP